MNIYKIVCVKDTFIDFFNEYDMILPILYQDNKNLYQAKQHNLIFEKMDGKQYLIDQFLSNRNDYIYKNNKYIINNIITSGTMHIIINEYDFEVYEDENQTTIFDYLSVYSKKFYMFSL